MAETPGTAGSGAAAANGYATSTAHGKKDGVCVMCGIKVGAFLATTCDEGVIHNECVAAYRRKIIERCAHCDQPLAKNRTIIKKDGKDVKLHPECLDDYRAGRKWEPPAMTGMVRKMAVGRSKWCGSKNWKDRFFVINQATKALVYYASEEAYRTGQNMKNMAAITDATRLVTKPTKFIHPQATNPSTQLIVVFKEGGQDLRLLFECKDWKEKDEWQRVLSCYIKDIDNPLDLEEKYNK